MPAFEGGFIVPGGGFAFIGCVVPGVMQFVLVFAEFVVAVFGDAGAFELGVVLELVLLVPELVVPAVPDVDVVVVFVHCVWLVVLGLVVVLVFVFVVVVWAIAGIVSPAINATAEAKLSIFAVMRSLLSSQAVLRRHHFSYPRNFLYMKSESLTALRA